MTDNNRYNGDISPRTYKAPISMTRLFLLPLLLALGWLLFLLWWRIPLRQGLKGFCWIIGLGGGLALLLSLMMWLTR